MSFDTSLNSVVDFGFAILANIDKPRGRFDNDHLAVLGQEVKTSLEKVEVELFFIWGILYDIVELHAVSICAAQPVNTLHKKNYRPGKNW